MTDDTRPALPAVSMETAMEAMHARIRLLEGVLTALASSLSAEQKRRVHAVLDITASRHTTLFFDRRPEDEGSKLEAIRDLADAYGVVLNLAPDP